MTVDSDVYIYHLIDPKNDEIRYVGKTIYPEHRYSKHLRDKTRTWRGKWIRSLLSRGLEPFMEIVETVPAGDDWAARERWWITKMREGGCRLTNCTDGGEGSHGRECTLETRRKIGQANKGCPGSMLGKAHSKETREKIGRASRSRTYGEETREKHRQLMLGNTINLGRDFGEAFREKMSRITRGELNGSSKLTAIEVVQIRDGFTDGVGAAELAETFGVSCGTIYTIVARRSWKHLE